MSSRDPVSVLLPTVEWTAACDQLAAQLEPGDELLVVCDDETDPVADREPPAGVEICVAGEPEGCSGKANALAHGMERATNDRFVWTDDDFERDAEWLDRLVAAGERHGPATAVPCFVGSGWWRPFEPWFGVLFTLLLYFQVGRVADTAWGGGVTFTRSEVTGSVPSLVEELRTVLSDDYLLTQRLSAVHPVRSMVTHVTVPGDLGSVRHRLHRFVRITGVNGGWASGVVVNTLLALVGLLFPAAVAPLATVGFGVVYGWLDRRPTSALLGYPGMLVLPVVTVASMLVETFEWGGRRYRYPDTGTVEVLSSDDGSR